MEIREWCFEKVKPARIRTVSEFVDTKHSLKFAPRQRKVQRLLVRNVNYLPWTGLRLDTVSISTVFDEIDTKVSASGPLG